MNKTLPLLSFSALLLVAMGLSACDRKETVVAVPVPSEPASVPVPGPPGPQGEPGKPGESSTVIVMPPAEPASAASAP